MNVRTAMAFVVVIGPILIAGMAIGMTRVVAGDARAGIVAALCVVVYVCTMYVLLTGRWEEDSR